MLPVQPQPDGCSDRTVTLSASPGLAPSMKTGPVTGLTKARSSFFRASAVEVFESCPEEASLVSNCTVSPGAIGGRGGDSLVHPRWPHPRVFFVLSLLASH